MRKTITLLVILPLLLLSIAACNGNKADQNGGDSPAATADTAVMDTPMSTGTGTDTIEQKLREGEDGTGKPSTDPRTRKQQ